MTMSDSLFALTLVTALGAGLSAGALFAFSSFVMDALHRLPAAQGVAAMQSINVRAITPAFMTAVFGTGLLAVALGLWALAGWDGSYSPWLLAGSALYLAGPVGVTIAYNVPRNNALARLDAESAEAAAYWERYVVEWTRANHVRVAAGLAAAAALTVAVHVA
jgi:uncharacterized membrane protein